MNFVALDVETANSDRGSICQIGWVRFRDGEPVDSFTSLVNPESPFLQRNILIHGITPEHVHGSPTFATLFPRLIADLTCDFIAHHGSFDWQSFAHACLLNNLALPSWLWVDTQEMSEFRWPGWANYKLDSVCGQLGISLQAHHNALHDAEACGGIVSKSGFGLVHLRQFGRKVEKEDARHFSTRYHGLGPGIIFSSSTGRQARFSVEKGLGELSGILEGFLADDVVVDLEMYELKTWVSSNASWLDLPPWTEILVGIEVVVSSSVHDWREVVQDLSWLVNRLRSQHFQGVAIELLNLEGLFRGILSDGILRDSEVVKLQSWLNEHGQLAGNFLYDELDARIKKVLMDGLITAEERNDLICFMLQFVSHLNEEARGCFVSNEIESDVSTAIYGQPPVDFENRSFCLSGSFQLFGSKLEIEGIIQSRGGVVVGSMTKKVNYLVVGSNGSSDWRFGAYGRKVEKAMEFKSKGFTIEVIDEHWFHAALNVSG